MCSKCQEFFKRESHQGVDFTHIKKYGRCRKCYDIYWFDFPVCYGGLKQCPVCLQSSNLDEKHWEVCGALFSADKSIYL